MKQIRVTGATPLPAGDSPDPKLRRTSKGPAHPGPLLHLGADRCVMDIRTVTAA